MTKPRPTGSAMEYVDRELARDPQLRRDVEEELTQLRLVQDLVALRERRGLSQVQLAKTMGITQPRVARIEAGKNLELRTIVRMAMALGARVHVELETLEQQPTEAVVVTPATMHKHMTSIKSKLKGKKLAGRN